jgi:hypothetical protein
MSMSQIVYRPGNWYHAVDIDDMEQFFYSRLPAIREAARKLGYAIGVHGSCRRDFDLMAMPWTSEASSIEALAHAVAIAACGITRDAPYRWEKKPAGRYAVSIPICWPEWDDDRPSLGMIDLSVIPTIED